MKLGVSTWSLLGMDVYSAVRAIGDAGAECVELWGEVPHAYPDWVDRKRLKDTLSSYDMQVTTHAPFTDLNPACPFQPVKGAIEKTMERFVEFSAALGASMITVHPGSVHNEQLVPESGGSSASLLRKLVKAAGGRLSINIENLAKGSSRYHFPLASTSESLELLLADVEGSMCTFDTGHAHINGQDLPDVAGRIGDRLAEIHLSDNRGSSDEHLIPGEGSARFDGLLGRVSNPDVLLCLELNPHVYSADKVLGSLERTRSALSLPRG